MGNHMTMYETFRHNNMVNPAYIIIFHNLPSFEMLIRYGKPHQKHNLLEQKKGQRPSKENQVSLDGGCPPNGKSTWNADRKSRPQ